MRDRRCAGAPRAPRLPGVLRAAAVALAASLVPLAAHADEKVDVIVLQNGTRVVGEVKSMKKARLEVSTDDMGTLQIEWGNVVEVTAPGFFEVEDMAGRLFFGSLRRGPQQASVEVVADWGNDVVPLEEVARIQLVKSGFWDRINGSVDAGAAYTSATELLQLDLDGQIRYRRPKFETSVTADAVMTQQPDVEDTQRASVTLSYTRIFSNRQRFFTQATLEQNRELGFERRTSLVGGWSTYLARNERNELLGGAGLSVNRERPVEGEATTNFEAAVGFSYANFAYDFPNTDIQVSSTAYLGLSQWGRFRLEANASLKRELFKDFYFGLRGYESYDSEPATEGAARNDWGLTLTLGYKF